MRPCWRREENTANSGMHRRSTMYNAGAILLKNILSERGWMMQYKIIGCISVLACIIFVLIIMKVRSKKWMAEQTDGGKVYFVRTLPILSAILSLGVVMFLCFTVGCIFSLDGGGLVVAILIFGGFTVLELAAYFCVLFWMIAVNEEAGILIYYRPPLRPVRVRISEITRIQILENRLNSPEQYRIKVYRGEKKLFEITDMMLGFRWLREYLETTEAANQSGFYEYGVDVDKRYKIEKGYLRAGEVELVTERKEVFTVTPTTIQKVWSGIATSVWLVMDAVLAYNWDAWIQEDSQFLFVYAVVLFITVVGLTDFIPKMLFKISVSNHEIRVRKGIRKELTYTKREITRVETKGNFIVLYMGGKRIAKVSKEYKNAVYLAEWLNRQLS